MPIYTYECSFGHAWDEGPKPSKGSETSETPCPTCEGTYYGRKIPTNMNPAFKGRGWTPTYYPNRKENK